MAKRVQKIKVDDVEYQITQIGGVEGLDLFDRLTLALGDKMLAGIRDALANRSGDGVEEVLAAILGRALVTLPVDIKRELWTKFAQLTTITAGEVQLPLCPPGGKLQPDDTFDQHFAGRLHHATKWLLAAMQWGFAGFLPKSDSSDAATAAAKPSR